MASAVGVPSVIMAAGVAVSGIISGVEAGAPQALNSTAVMTIRQNKNWGLRIFSPYWNFLYRSNSRLRNPCELITKV
jgi:hypothetical protein